MEVKPKTLNVVNCTPHSITILETECFLYHGAKPKVKAEFPPSGQVARVEYNTTLVGRVLHKDRVIDITTTEYTAVKGLPDPKPNTIYLVSKLVAEALYGKRDDLYILSGFRKDKNGKVLGGRSFAKLKPINS